MVSVPTKFAWTTSLLVSRTMPTSPKRLITDPWSRALGGTRVRPDESEPAPNRSARSAATHLVAGLGGAVDDHWMRDRGQLPDDRAIVCTPLPAIAKSMVSVAVPVSALT